MTTIENIRPEHNLEYAELSPIQRAWDHARRLVYNSAIDGIPFGTSSHDKYLIEGDTNIYWASPDYGHADYNKSVAFKNTPENRRVMAAINGYLTYAAKGLKGLIRHAKHAEIYDTCSARREMRDKFANQFERPANQLRVAIRAKNGLYRTRVFTF